MKKILLSAALILTAFAVKAQDLIVLRNAEEISAKVTAITPDAVTYKRWSNPDGPTYTIEKAQIFYIKYQNGEKDVFSSVTTPKYNTNDYQNNLFTPTQSQVAGNLTPIKFQGYAQVGAIFTAEGGGPTLDLTFGAKIYEYFYVGAEVGFHTCLTPYEYYGYYGSYSGEIFEAYVPIGVNMKGYFTKGRKVNPYINCSLGGFVGVADIEGLNGFHCQVGLGIDIKRFSFGIGYNGLVKGAAKFNSGYVKLGVRFGK